MAFVPPARHLLRAKDLADARYFEHGGAHRRDHRRAGQLPLAYRRAGRAARRRDRADGNPRPAGDGRRDGRAGANPHGKGFAGTIFLATEDCQASYEELKGRGVEFVEQPEERPYGIDSSFRDPSGNHFRLTQVQEPAAV